MKKNDSGLILNITREDCEEVKTNLVEIQKVFSEEKKPSFNKNFTPDPKKVYYNSKKPDKTNFDSEISKRSSMCHRVLRRSTTAIMTVL